jgi:predicted transcriptional regulator
MENTDKKNKVIEALSKYGKLPQGKLSILSGINYDYIKEVLEDLEKEGLIECEKAGELATYWNLKNETNNEN